MRKRELAALLELCGCFCSVSRLFPHSALVWYVIVIHLSPWATKGLFPPGGVCRPCFSCSASSNELFKTCQPSVRRLGVTMCYYVTPQFYKIK